MALYFPEKHGTLSITGRGTLSPELVHYVIYHNGMFEATAIDYKDYKKIMIEAADKHVKLRDLPPPTENEIRDAKALWSSMGGLVKELDKELDKGEEK